MTVKPTAPLAPHPALDVTKSSGVGSESKKPAPARARPWTWTRIVRYVSLYYLVNVIGVGITIEGFRRLVAAGDTDLWARARATGVVAAGNLLRGVAAAGEEPVGHAAVGPRRHGRVHAGVRGRGPLRPHHHGRVRLLLPLPASVLIHISVYVLKSYIVS
jgi:hypothetical protein